MKRVAGIVLSLLVTLGILAGCAGAPQQSAQQSGATRQETAAPAAGQAAPSQAAPKQEAKPAAKKLEKTNLVIAVAAPSSMFTHIYIAEKKGYWKDEGLDVKLNVFSSGADATKTLIAGALDISINNLTQVMSAIEAKQDIKAFWAGINMSQFDWYAPKIKSMQEAKGARFGVTRLGTLSDILTRVALEKYGLDPDKDVKILQVGTSSERVAAMEAGQLDVSILGTPQQFMAAEKGWNQLLTQKKDIAPDWPSDIYYAKMPFIEQNPETIKAFLRGIARGVRFLKANPKEASAIMAEYIKVEPRFAEMAQPDIAEEAWEDGRLPGPGLDEFMKVSVKLGDIKEPWPKERYWDNRFHSTYSQWKP